MTLGSFFFSILDIDEGVNGNSEKVRRATLTHRSSRTVLNITASLQAQFVGFTSYEVGSNVKVNLKTDGAIEVRARDSR